MVKTTSRSDRPIFCVIVYSVVKTIRAATWLTSNCTLLRRASKDKRRKRKKREKLCHWFIPLNLGEGSFRLVNFKSTFAIFFCVLLKVNGLLCDRRMITSQKTTSAMTLLLCGRGSFQHVIPKINMLHNLSCCDTRFRLLCRSYLLHSSINLAFRQCNLHNILIFGMAYSSLFVKSQEPLQRRVVKLGEPCSCKFELST